MRNFIEIGEMDISARKADLIKKIGSINDEHAVEALEQTLSFFFDNSKDITDELSAYQLAELTSLVQEAGEKDSLSETEYKKATSQWRTKS
jgi:predicted  nucleic acid-binding Zn-ribbon protein